MAQNSNRRAATYAKKSTQAKKKRTTNSNGKERPAPACQDSLSDTSASSQNTQPVSPRGRAANKETAGSAYAYVFTDLKQTVAIAAAMFIILIVLAIVL